MVERLKKAIEKARVERDRVLAESAVAAPATVAHAEAAVSHHRTGSQPYEVSLPPQADRKDPLLPAAWEALEEIALDPDVLEKARVISFRRNDPAHVAFDLLRTRLMKVFKDNNWSRIAITSPTKGCGKTFVATNLALSLARQAECRTMLVDMDLRQPGVARTLGQTELRSMEWYLRGQTSPDAFFKRVGPNLALGLNTERVRDSAELIQHELTSTRLESMRDLYKADVVIYDLPPMLSCDDTIAFLGQVDCVLLIAAANHTKPKEIEECARMLSESTNFLGVLLNKCDERHSDSYRYGYYD